MILEVNGKAVPVVETRLLLDFLLQAGYDVSRIAVELNGEIVPKRKYEMVQLEADDVLEVVTFVGGG